MIVAGVEEAGRGPVIGPMVMAICAIDKSKLYLLEEIGVKDSKMLSPKKREALISKIKEICEVNVLILSPKIIDGALADPSMNLNWLEAKTSAKLINSVNCEKAILDCPSANTLAYKNYVQKLLKKEVQIISEHKADEKYVVVGAASIVAKVIRDKEIQKLRDKTGVDFGSGYPADPKTKEFLKENWDKFDFFRKSWKTYKKLANKKLGDF